MGHNCLRFIRDLPTSLQETAAPQLLFSNRSPRDGAGETRTPQRNPMACVVTKYRSTG